MYKKHPDYAVKVKRLQNPIYDHIEYLVISSDDPVALDWFYEHALDFEDVLSVLMHENKLSMTMELLRV